MVSHETAEFEQSRQRLVQAAAVLLRELSGHDLGLVMARNRDPYRTKAATRSAPPSAAQYARDLPTSGAVRVGQRLRTRRLQAEGDGS
jgi:hypothetical protein